MQYRGRGCRRKGTPLQISRVSGTYLLRARMQIYIQTLLPFIDITFINNYNFLVNRYFDKCSTSFRQMLFEFSIQIVIQNSKIILKISHNSSTQIYYILVKKFSPKFKNYFIIIARR